jgi:hypothetical protein
MDITRTLTLVLLALVVVLVAVVAYLRLIKQAGDSDKKSNTKEVAIRVYVSEGFPRVALVESIWTQLGYDPTDTASLPLTVEVEYGGVRTKIRAIVSPVGYNVISDHALELLGLQKDHIEPGARIALVVRNV